MTKKFLFSILFSAIMATALALASPAEKTQKTSGAQAAATCSVSACPPIACPVGTCPDATACKKVKTCAKAKNCDPSACEKKQAKKGSGKKS